MRTVVLIICGVSGVGKTLLGRLLAEKLGWQFYDADDFHPQASIDLMRSGVPLTDQDREPWLDRLRELIAGCLAESASAVLACSALKKKYRDVLRVSDQVRFVFLRGDYATVATQLEARHSHFMNPQLLRSQFADVEEPRPEERAIVVQIGRPPSELADEVIAQLQHR